MAPERVSAKYSDQSSARAYAAWQLAMAAPLAHANAARFQPFVRSDDIVLDFGCGGGGILQHLACGRRIGVEPNPTAREECAMLGIECYPDVVSAPAPVDVVISNHALEHCLSPYDDLCALRHSLRPGGTLVLVLPINDWRSERRPHLPDLHHHLYTWTPQLIANLLSEVGFFVERASVLTHAWPPGFSRLHGRIPTALWEAGCYFTSALLLRRQILTVARRV